MVEQRPADQGSKIMIDERNPLELHHCSGGVLLPRQRTLAGEWLERSAEVELRDGELKQ
jgi:hypothetical protein